MSTGSTLALHTGGCLCEAVRYEVRGQLGPVVNCHCEQCRRTRGHFVAATAASIEALVFSKKFGLMWCRSSNSPRRGFCRVCGSSLFWQQVEGQNWSDVISMVAGALDRPTGLDTVANIYVTFAGDYCEIDERSCTGHWHEMVVDSGDASIDTPQMKELTQVDQRAHKANK